MDKFSGKRLGLGIIIISLIFLIVYTWSIWFSSFDLLIIKLTSFGVVIMFIAAVIWIGKTMFTAKMIGMDLDN